MMGKKFVWAKAERVEIKAAMIARKIVFWFMIF
jgi:hypothetical protein